MSLFRRSSMETRSSSDGWLSVFGTGKGLDGSMKSALRLVPLYAATSLIADSISIMPVNEYESAGGSTMKAKQQSTLLLDPHPAPTMTRIEWLHQFTSSFLLRGNSYGLITAIDDAGTPSKIAWLHPDSVQVDESGFFPVYRYKGEALDSTTVIHIPWYPMPGTVVGLSPISQFRQMLETGSMAERYGKEWFSNGSTPSGHLKYNKGSLEASDAAKVKSRFKQAVAGNDIFVSGSDWDWAALSVAPDEAQFLETIKATANQIAAIYRVDPSDIGGEAGNSLTYSTLEMNQIKFQTRALQPIFTRLEHHITRLLPESHYMKFNPDALVRTDIKTRTEVNKTNIEIGLLTQDEGRELEERPILTDKQKQEWQKHYGKNKPTPAKEETS
ncbi:phage portal protein [Arthrobacter sp. MYb213]|uniref:phage portal protein n=1 Tax=Arthrobacter sp. MYb213 TaxID=1848595 RepID=UPI000CFB8A2D|nr:phage portal protein [Arthrobacter sp. MYb213]PRB69511.1 phage portal protein [Arthrobacter sp. MYb213]